MKSNLLKPLVFLLGTLIFAALLLCQPASSRADESLIPAAPLASKTVPVGANLKIPGAPSFSTTGEPAIAFDGTNFLVVLNTETAVSAVRISQAGAILDSPPITVTVGLSSPVYAASVVFDGTNYLCVWIASTAEAQFDLFGARISPAGAVLSPGVVRLTTDAQPSWWQGSPSLVWDGSQLLVTWGSNGIHAARFTPTLTNLDPPAGFEVLAGSYWNTFSAAFDGSNYLVAASGNPTGGENGNDIYAARFSREGAVLDPGGFVVYSDPNEQDRPEAGFDGSNFLVAWVDYALPVVNPDQLGIIFARRVSPAGVPLDAAPIQAASQVMVWGVEPFDLICDLTDCLLTWNSPSNPFREIDIWARRIVQGAVQDPQAIPVAATFGQQYWPVIGGGSGHTLVAWTENVSRDSGTYAQRLERQTLLQPASQPASSQPALALQVSGPAWYAERIPGSRVTGGVAFSTSKTYAASWDHILKRGNGWQIEATLAQDGPHVLWASGPNDIWLTGACMYQVVYDGQAWFDYACRFPPPEYGSQTATSLWGSSPTEVWGTGVQGMLFRYNASHWNDWIFQHSGIPFDLADLWGTSASNIYAVGERGSILRYNGSAWVPQASIPTIQRLNAAWGSGANDIFAVGDWGTILHFNGSAWTEMSSGVYTHLYGVWGSSATNVYAAGSEGTVLHYDGAAWSAENVDTNMDLYAVWGAPGGLPVWAGGSGDQILVKEYRAFLSHVKK